MMLGRMEHLLDAAQPEEQHGFRAHRRIEEHLLTANLLIDKPLANGIPIWIISLDLSKAFDRVEWRSLWKALRSHGVSDHLIWLLQCLYHEQRGEVQGDCGRSRVFKIHAGVRQGCVLSTRLFCWVLEWAMNSWKDLVGTAGFDLGDGLRQLLDLRFADDILLCTKSEEEARRTLDLLIAALGEVGLILNVEKTVVMTTEAQPPQHLILSSGHRIQILPRSTSHRWLGCMLSAGESQQQHEDITHHLAAASKSFYANFAAGHRTLHKCDLQRLDVEYKRLLRAVVGPPGSISWDGPWHEILHLWNNKVRNVCSENSMRAWREQSLAS